MPQKSLRPYLKFFPHDNVLLINVNSHALGGHAKTLMFAHVSPEGEYFGETISTLKFAQRVSTIELGAACTNKESREVMQLKEEVSISYYLLLLW